MPAVSVILPTFNRADRLRGAVESVLAQTYTDWELILIDDGSTDATWTVARGLQKSHPRIHCVRQANQGVGAARNTGGVIARGKYIAFLDDDDRWVTDKLSRQVAYMEAHPEIGLSYGRHCVMGGRPDRPSIHPQRLITGFEELLGNCAIWLPTVMVRRGCLDAVGWFNPRYRRSGDYDLCLRLSQRVRIGALEEVLTLLIKDGRQRLTTIEANIYEAGIKVVRSLPLRPAYHYLEGKRRRCIARDYYELGRLAIDEGQYHRAARAFLSAILTDPLVGLAVRRSDERGRLTRMIRVLKAYAALPWCLIKGFSHAGR